MDNRTLIIIALVVDLIESLTLISLALYRRERPLIHFALAFSLAAVGSALLLGQGTVTPFVSIFLANLFLLALPLLLVVGFRAFYGVEPAWPRRFPVYVVLIAAAVLLTTYLDDSYELRVIVFAASSALFYVEGIALLWSRRRDPPPFIQYVGMATGVALIVLHAVRVVLVILLHPSSILLLQDTVVTPYTITFLLASGLVWLNLILLADSSKLVEEMRRANRTLESQARTDELTGLLNRNAFEQLALDGPAAERRRVDPHALLLLDLDDFKTINDDFGHKAGDEALKRTAERLRGLVRTSDAVYRWGGEEFLVLAPGLTVDDAQHLAERIREAVKRSPDDGVRSVTASIGVAVRRSGEDKDAWFRRADQALYRAKNLGKDRVIVAG